MVKKMTIEEEIEKAEEIAQEKAREEIEKIIKDRLEEIGEVENDYLKNLSSLDTIVYPNTSLIPSLRDFPGNCLSVFGGGACAVLGGVVLLSASSSFL